MKCFLPFLVHHLDTDPNQTQALCVGKKVVSSIPRARIQHVEQPEMGKIRLNNGDALY